MSSERTKPCPACNEPMGINRGVCPECGHQTTWFKFRLYLGCAGALFAAIIIGLMMLSALYGVGQPQ